TGYIDGKKCHCLQLKIRKLLYAQSNLENILNKENFENFSFDYYDNKTILPGQNMTNAAYMEGVKRFCEKFADKYFKINASKNAVDTALEENDRRNIIFSGNTGVGKTYLSICIAKVLLDRYYSAIYLSAKELFEALVKVKLEKSEDQKYLLLIEEVYESDMLIIDDLGTELSNHFTTTEFFHIINRRVNTEKSTIISTNLSLDEMRDIYSERVTSRIRKSFMYIRLFGNDIRAKL
ncbi:MAG: ATP-binding protein, partial [Lachnoanaerobaculum gingivalis]